MPRTYTHQAHRTDARLRELAGSDNLKLDWSREVRQYIFVAPVRLLNANLWRCLQSLGEVVDINIRVDDILPPFEVWLSARVNPRGGR